ncbi:MAG: hypothetical protein ACOCP4_00920 [Candidatus Woesearchaeota archaeon]
MLKFVERHKKPEVCIITPLRPQDKISKETKITVKRNNINRLWVTYTSDGNVAYNFKKGFEELKNVYKNLPPYTIKIDANTIWNRKTLDYLSNTLKNSGDNIAYAYCSFKYQGTVNNEFPALNFDPLKLKQMNYISSNSLFKTWVLEKFPIISDEKYKRLLDWAYYLHLLNNGYIGIPCGKGYFISISHPDNVSSGDRDDFLLKYKRVKEDFVI